MLKYAFETASTLMLLAATGCSTSIPSTSLPSPDDRNFVGVVEITKCPNPESPNLEADATYIYPLAKGMLLAHVRLKKDYGQVDFAYLRRGRRDAIVPVVLDGKDASPEQRLARHTVLETIKAIPQECTLR